VSKELFFKDKKFSPLLWTQFFGALNDNFFKNALVMIVTYKSVSLWGLNTASLVALSGGIFILPFLLFSSVSGQLCDKYEKSKIARLVKWLELAIMLIGAIGFYFHNFHLLFFALFLMGLHSTFFGPVKYSIIPELLSEKQLTAGNAYVEVGTFVAILIGTIIGGVGADSVNTVIIPGTIAVALVGLIISYFIPAVPIADPHIKINANPLGPIFSTLKLSFKNKSVFNSILGISWFWFFGAAILSILPVLTKDLLSADKNVVTLFLAVFTIGIAIGAVVCEKLSYERVEIGLVPWGSLGITLFLLDFAWVLSDWPISQSQTVLSVTDFLAVSGSHRLLIDLFMISIFGGVFTVPLYTLIQERSARDIRSRIIAANNVLNSLFMVVSSLMLTWFYALHMTIPQILIIYAILNFIVSIYIYTVVPEFTLRLLSWFIARLVYRIHVRGHQHIPKEGAALLVCNHVSFVDWLILAAAIKRPVRFVMYYKFFQIPLVRYLFKHASVIPIAGASEDKAIFDQAFERVSQDLQAGELVCIFPEGTLTKNGEVSPFKKGIEHIIAKNPVNVIPMSLGGLWGSIFSHKDKKAMTKLPRKIWFRVDVTIGSAVAAENVSAEYLEKQVITLQKS
jgi:1-acyl-sn-glycerol-3-phosphate acyltransferase